MSVYCVTYQSHVEQYIPCQLVLAKVQRKTDKLSLLKAHSNPLQTREVHEAKWLAYEASKSGSQRGDLLLRVPTILQRTQFRCVHSPSPRLVHLQSYYMTTAQV